MNTDAWRWLACPHCAARLERKNSRYLLPLVSFFLAVLPLNTLLGPRHFVLAEGLLIAVVLAILVVLLRPHLQLRKPPPEPEIRLNIGE
jgi:carbon starvation protein CstA